MQKLSNASLNRLSIASYKKAAKAPLIIVLENVRSLNNIGSIFRTADAFRVEKIYLCGFTATPPHREIHKTALGATESVAWEYMPSALDCILKLKQQHYVVVSVEQATGSIPIHHFSTDFALHKYALIFGNELDGVSPEVINASDCCLEIPQFGTKHSFNIAVSVGIVLWELCREYIRSESSVFAPKTDRAG